MESRSRRKVSGILHDSYRQNPLIFQDGDPDDFIVQDTEFAGKGLFAKRFFPERGVSFELPRLQKGWQQ